MRPVNKGSVPEEIESQDGFKKYQYARRYLIDRIGDYCSYCERKLFASLAVEHVEPKSLVERLEKNWSNFLLACVNCNSTKSDKPIKLEDYVWPHRDNTYPLFQTNQNGLVEPSSDLKNPMLSRVKSTIELVGLDSKQPNEGTNNYLSASDRRHENRIQALMQSNECLSAYEASSEKENLLGVFIQYMKNSGFWSIWMRTFKDHKEVQEALIDNFPGTNFRDEILSL